MKVLKSRSGKLLFALLTMLILVSLAVWSHFIARYFDYSAEIKRLQPLMSRMVGMKESELRFREADQQVRASLAQLSITAVGTDAAIADLQSKVRSVVADSDMSVSGSQILPTVEGAGYQQLSVNVTIKGAMSALPALLHNLNDMQPRTIISSIQLSPARSRRDGPQNVTIRINVLALRTKT